MDIWADAAPEMTVRGAKGAGLGGRLACPWDWPRMSG